MIRDRLPEPLVMKYYCYRATVTFGFFWPVFTVFLLHRGLTFTQIGVLGSISAALVVVGELPTGYVGDRLGRRNSLLIASGLLAVSVLGFAVAHSFAGFVALYTLWALGLAFRSGSGDAWLYDALDARLRADEYTRVRGRGGAIGQWTSAATMLAAGALYELDPRLPFVAGGVLVLASIPVVASMPATDHRDGDDAASPRELLAVARRHLTDPPLRSFVLYVALFFAVVNAADEFIQPVAVNALALPEAGLGPLYFGFTVAAAVASYYADDLERLLSTRLAVLLVPALVAVFLVAPLAVSVVALPTFFVLKSANAAIAPIASGYLNDRVESAGRATVLSAASMAYALVRLPVKPAIGAVADATSPIAALAVLGTGFLVVGGIVVARERPVQDVEGESSAQSAG